MMVTIPAGCGWQAFPVLSGGYFVYITSPPIPAPGAGANSIGPGPLTYTVLPNTTGNARSLHMSIASVGFVVTQDAGP